MTIWLVSMNCDDPRSAYISYHLHGLSRINCRNWEVTCITYQGTNCEGQTPPSCVCEVPSARKRQNSLFRPKQPVTTMEPKAKKRPLTWWQIRPKKHSFQVKYKEIVEGQTWKELWCLQECIQLLQSSYSKEAEGACMHHDITLPSPTTRQTSHLVT